MPELYRLADNTHVNTQAEAKHSGQPWEKVDVPTKRHDLLAYLNEIVANVRGATSPQPAADVPLEPEETASPPQPVPVAPTIDAAAEKRRLVEELASLSVEEIEDKIMEAKPNDMARYLLCSIGRLGELGRTGWEYVQAHRHFTRDAEQSQQKVKPERRYLPAFNERGLRYLCLMLLEDMNGSAKVDDTHAVGAASSHGRVDNGEHQEAAAS